MAAQNAQVAPAAIEAAQDAIQTAPSASGNSTLNGSSSGVAPADPLGYGQFKRQNTSSKQIKVDHPAGNKKKIKKYYTRQNELIDKFLGAEDEEANKIEEDIRYKPKIKFAVNASFCVNFFLFVIQMYAAISTGSLSLFATAADAFMDLVSSFVMLITSRMAARASVYKYPLLIESGRNLGGGPHESEELHIVPIIFIGVAIFAKGSLMVYCFFYRRFPSVHIFFVDHRNDIAVNIFGLIMFIVGDRFVWYLDPIGAMLIALLILFSWAANAFEQVWLLVGKSAPKEFISKLIYMCMTHDDRILKVETCRAYHAGQHYYVEIDIIMEEETPLKISHDVAQELQRKIEGLSSVERAFVHTDYDHDHDPHEEHKPLYEKHHIVQAKKRPLKDILLFRKKQMRQDLAATEQAEQQASS
ncbi:hypothetical protein B0T16DRAFT_334160 [Cercophora newfieldiana]|uniref:Cation efflux protein cytoplasmic domain-containing protein n=1 Tax=Cercophora newfieldiana TaxID=92897 RepID=A0AA39XWU1_9PEZI|nr:hypothetical protein B0T16DRAFT_334160 [Cercophora newfieldiana]